MQQAEFTWGPTARALIAAGPRACEALLLERLDALFEEHEGKILERPIRLVVPSKSLRLHVLERVLAHRGGCVIGLDCRTHRGLALDIAERAGIRPSVSTDLFPLFARRLAQKETPLRRTLDHLKDGYAAVLSSVGDLLDAGIDPAHLEALEEVLEVEGTKVATPFEVERAKSLVRIAAGTATVLEQQSLGRSSHLLNAATTLVRRSPDLLPSSAVLVHGYNDATGLVTDFLLALVQTFGGDILLDDPPDPVHPTADDVPDAGVRFAEIYRERVEATLGAERARPEGSVQLAPPRLDLFRALGCEAEAREVAHRIKKLLGRGANAERIGVVTRTLGSYRRAIRTHFDRLGVPYSGVAPSGAKDPSAFKVSALLEVLRQQEDVPVERWLDACRLEPGARNDLELALRTLGIGRLFEAAALDVRRFVGTPDGKGLRLPVRTGFTAEDGDPHASYRYVSSRTVEQAVQAAGALVKDLGRWSVGSCLGEHLEALRELIEEHLHWPSDSPLATSVWAELDSWTQGIGHDLELDFYEFTSLLAYRLDNFGATAMGGQGGGVQVLDVVEARSRTFDHLFLLGVNRGVFPRVVQEDSLLPDRLREALSRRGFGVLPDLHRKLPGFDEERYLFAQLLAGSPEITVSWLEVDDEHVFRTPSPLVERLRWSHPDPPASWKRPLAAAPIYADPETAGADSEDRERPALESVTLAGIFGTRDQFSSVLDTAEAECRARFPELRESFDSPAAKELAPIRLRILNEFDPVRGSTAGELTYGGLGPYFGFVGPITGAADPRRRRRLFVTTLEALARCPWRTFLERLLRVEKLPDPLDVLPGVNALLVGNLVHGVLESIVRAGLESRLDDLSQARQAKGARVPWPNEDEFERILAANARKVALDESITLPGFERVLAGVCRRHLEAARELDWPNGESRFEVLASEQRGELVWKNPPAVLAFKADRVDRNDDRLIFTDYKTGKPLGGDSRYRKKDRQLLLEGVRAGERLQAVLYARAGGGPQDAGRYAFLKPSLEPGRDREVLVRANDGEIGALFERAVASTLDTWQRGSFFPRLVQHHKNVEPAACGFCQVAEACLRGDSGSRGRLRTWAEARHPGRAPEPGALERTILRTWYLGDPTAFSETAPESEDPARTRGRSG